MRRFLLFTGVALGLLALGNKAFALEDGDYVYTTSARYQVISGSSNLVTNGYFTNTDYSDSEFGWTDADGANLGTYLSIEPNAGPNGENVLLSSSGSSSSLMQAIPFTAGKQYIITLQIKGVEDAPTYYGSSTSSNFVDVYALKDKDGDQDDSNNYQTIADYDYVTSDWHEISFAFADESLEDGYIIILLQNLTAETLVGNFEVREVEQVGDDREVNSFLEEAISLIESGEFPSDENGFAEAVYGVYYSGLEDPSMWDSMDEVTSVLTELEDMREIWLDENSSDASDYFSSFSPSSWSKYNAGTLSSIGSWTFTGAASRWGHSSGSEYGYYYYSNGYNLGWGKAEIAQTDMPSGRYLWAIESYIKKLATGRDYSGSSSKQIPFYSYKITNEAYVFFGDTKVMIDTLSYDAGKYYVFADLEEGDTLKAGIYFPGFGDEDGSDGGGYFYFGNPEIRLLGTSATDAANAAYIEDIITQQTELALRLEYAKEDLELGYPWGTDSLQNAIDVWGAVYDESLSYVTSEGLVDGVSVDDIPEDYDDSLLVAVRQMNYARNYYASVNSPYTTLVAYVVTAQSYLDDATYSEASSSSRSALEDLISSANSLIANVSSDVDNSDEFTSLYNDLMDAITAFTMSAASYSNPAEILYSNNSFEDDGDDWDVTTESGNGALKYGADSNFTDGYKAYAYRGNAASPQNKVRRSLTITEPGVYEFYAQAYALNTNESKYNSLWNGLTGEDSVRTANVFIFFGLVDEYSKQDVFTYQENFGDYSVGYDTLGEFIILYTKTTDSSVEEEVEFGFNALSNGYDDDGEALEAGANIYGFGSTHLYYFGSEESYAAGISAAKANEIQADDYVYSISGVRMGKASDNLPKGVYISKGQKFIVK